LYKTLQIGLEICGKMFGTLAKTRKSAGKIVSIEQAKAAVRTARQKRARVSKRSAKPSDMPNKKFERWLKDTYDGLSLSSS
jgi:hypothetical protein